MELQALAEKHNTESSLDLEQSQREALDDVETQLRDCQSYVDQLEVTPDKLQVYLPNLQHQVGRLQRTYHTILSINPAICEGSTVPTNLARLTNHLQRLEGRLEVIPEEEGLDLSEGHDLQRWRETIVSEDVSQQSTDPDDLLTQLSTALHMLTTSPCSTEIVLDDLLIRYEEVLHTANCGLLDPTILSEERDEVAEEIRITKVRMW